MRQDVDRIHDAAQYLMRLINIILDLSKIEAGLMQFTVEKTDIAEIVNEAADRVRDEMRENGNTMELSVESEDRSIETDKQRLLQVLSAILDNIPVHAPGAHAEIRVEAVDHDGSSGFQLRIKDNGGGIRPDRLATIFEALADQRDASASRYGGTGLNLTIINKLARSMGCTLSVESKIGRGTCFTIFLPRSWSPMAHAPVLPQHTAEAA